MTKTIPADVAAYLFESSDGERHEGWTRVTEYDFGAYSRWLKPRWLVVTEGDGLFGVEFAYGKTEMQEHEFPWRDHPDKPIELIRLVPEVVTTTQYKQVKP